MATYDTDNLKDAKPGETPEKQVGKTYPAGVYRHPQSGQEAITLEDPLYRNAQSEAFARVGFVRIRDAKPEEIKTLPALAFERKERVEMGSDDARLAKIERDQAVEKAARLERELAEARGETKEDREQIKEADEATTTPALADSAADAKEAAQASGETQAANEQEARAQTPEKEAGVTSQSVAEDAGQETEPAQDTDQETETEPESDDSGFRAETDKNGNPYFLNPEGQRISEEEYNKNVNKKGE